MSGSNQEVHVVHFFTELDSILDTRMGTLLRIDPDCTQRVVNGGYFDRDRDLFTGIDPNKFKEMYEKRDRLTLQASLMTPIVGYMRDFCMQTYEMNIKTPFLREPRLIINTYPYQLADSEIQVLLQALQVRTGMKTPIQFVNMSIEDITPQYLKQSTSIIATYDPYEWLDVHAKNNNLRKTVCLDVMMIGPLRWRDLTIQESIKRFQKDMEMLAHPFIDLQLMSPRMFMADVFTRVKKPQEQKKNDT